jgi:hypothetical protein
MLTTITPPNVCHLPMPYSLRTFTGQKYKRNDSKHKISRFLNTQRHVRHMIHACFLGMYIECSRSMYEHHLEACTPSTQTHALRAHTTHASYAYSTTPQQHSFPCSSSFDSELRIMHLPPTQNSELCLFFLRLRTQNYASSSFDSDLYILLAQEACSYKPEQRPLHLLSIYIYIYIYTYIYIYIFEHMCVRALGCSTVDFTQAQKLHQHSLYFPFT